MELEQYKITETECVENGVESAPNKLRGTTRENKKVFDKLVRFFSNRYNLLIDALQPNIAAATTHIASTDNPHVVTQSQVGLESVDNTSDLDKPISTSQQAALDLKADITIVDAKDSVILTAAKDYTDQKVVEIGAADMTIAVYDPTRKQSDVFAYADNVKAEANDYTDTKNVEVMKQLGNLATVATHAKAGTVHSLTLGKVATDGIQMVQFAATADYAEGNTWKVGAVVYTAKLQGEDGAVPDKYFVVGDMVSVMLDPAGNKLGFKSGGGGAELNVFCQLTEPTAPDGVWVKMADKPTYVAVKTYDDITVSGSWLTKAPMPTARGALAGSAIGNIIYCVGGIGVGTGRRNTNEAYDTISNTWSTKAPMPTARDVLAGSAIGAIIYCVGGVNASSSTIGTNEVYDTISNTWSTKASMPTARNGLAGSAIGTILYCICGNNNGALKTNEAYDTISNTWSTKVSMPTATQNCAGIKIGAVIYCMGGEVRDGALLKTNEAYDTISNTWSTKASMPTARADSRSNAIGTIIYCVGGRNAGWGQPNNSLSTNEVYDTISNTWSTKASMPTALWGMACAGVGVTVYAIGGSVNMAYNAAGTILPDNTLAIPNYGTQGKKTKLISDKKSELYTYINQPVYYVNGQQTYPTSYANYDNTGWQPIS